MFDESLRDIVGRLEEARSLGLLEHYAMIGGLAVSFWAEPRRHMIWILPSRSGAGRLIHLPRSCTEPIDRGEKRALKQGRTVSELVETALRLYLQAQKPRRPLPSLLSFKSGGYWVDIADRDALYQAMERH